MSTSSTGTTSFNDMLAQLQQFQEQMNRETVQMEETSEKGQLNNDTGKKIGDLQP